MDNWLEEVAMFDGACQDRSIPSELGASRLVPELKLIKLMPQVDRHDDKMHDDHL